MTPTEIDTLIERWLSSEIESLEDNLSDLRITDTWLEDEDLACDNLTEDLQGAMMSSDYHKVSQDMDEILKDAELPLLDHSSIEFKRMCRRLLRAKIELAGIEKERVHGNYPKRQVVAFASLVPAVAPPVKPTPMFSVVAKKYLEENPRSRRTQGQVQAEYERFIQVTGGDRPLGLITKVACRTYKEHLLQVRKVSLATVMKHLNILSGLFTWAERQGYMLEGASNPVKGLAPSKQESAKGTLVIRPFTDEELVRVFSSPNFIKQRVSWPERYWVSLMCLYQLCRREEAGQLALVDIGVKDEIPCISITDLGEDQSVKNPGSKRTIPIHTSLIALGFLEYVQDIRNAKHTRLFPQLTLHDHRYSDGIGKWFARHMNKVGLSQPELVMHSLRHGIHYLHALGCPQDVAEMLTGHTPTSLHDKTYDRRELTSLTRLRNGLERMQFSKVLAALQGVR